MKREFLRIEDVCVTSDRMQGLSHVSLNIFEGETVVLTSLAGNSTRQLLAIICGQKQPSSGRLLLHESKTVIKDEENARLLGIYKIDNENRLLGDLTVAENIFILRKNGWKGIPRHKLWYHQTQELLEPSSLNISPNILVKNLSRAEEHLVQLCKIAGGNGKLIIFDNVFSNYTPDDYLHLLNAINIFKRRGISFLLCCNKLEEIQLFADRVALFRADQLLSISEEKQMVGRLWENMRSNTKMQERETQSVGTAGAHICYSGYLMQENGLWKTFKFEAGEVAAVICTKPAHIAKAMAGISYRKFCKGYINGERVERYGEKWITLKIAYLNSPGDGQELIDNISAKDNLLFPSFRKISQNPFGIIRSQLYQVAINESRADFKWDRLSSELSRQDRIQLLLKRWEMFNPNVMIIHEPFAQCNFEESIWIADFIQKMSLHGSVVVCVTKSLKELPLSVMQAISLKD